MCFLWYPRAKYKSSLDPALKTHLKQLTFNLLVLLLVQNLHPRVWKALFDGQMGWVGAERGVGSEKQNAKIGSQKFLVFPAPLPESLYEVGQL